MLTTLLIRPMFLNLLIISCAILFPFIYTKVKHTRMCQLFELQLSDTTIILANSLRAGYSFEQALRAITQDLENPIRTEFERMIGDMALGQSLEECLDKIAVRMNSKEINMLNTTLAIQKMVGGNLAVIIEQLGDGIRERILLKK